MFLQKIFLLLILMGASIATSAQLTTRQKVYTRADTLRGSLRPERTCYDVLFYELRINLDTATRSIAGSVEMSFRALTDIQTLQVDLNEKFLISKIMYNGKSLAYTREFNAVFVAFSQPIRKGTVTALQIFYSGTPPVAKRAPWDGGFVWAHSGNGKPWVGVACEGLGASSWWPCKDHNSDEPDQGVRVMCTVPSNLVCVANGKAELHFPNNDGTTTYSWLVSYPINLYNVTLNVGDYVSYKEEYESSDKTKYDLSYYVLRENVEKAKKHFQQVKPMMKCYEQFLGKYPFARDGYKLVETPYLGMEHQSAIAYGNNYKTGYNGSDYSRIGLDFDYIIIHETGHEWWGNSVSCSDMADMWIHESFCTYSEAIYVECMYGRKKSLAYINAKKQGVGNSAPIQGQLLGVNEEGDGDMYSKGMLMLNSIRTIVNNDVLWWQIIKGIADTAFQYRVTNADEIVDYFNKKTGMNLTPVFHQYLKHAAIPKLIYTLKPLSRKRYELIYFWQTDEKDFEMPVVISVNDKEERLSVTNKIQTKLLKISAPGDLKINDTLGYFELEER